MIIHHVPMKSAQKSSFRKLVQYITDTQGKKERLGQVRVTNCNSIEHRWASYEIEAVQAKNQRAKGDKSYHLIISFAPNETPSNDVLKTIEERVSASIGLSIHQRISAVHHDTDNLHIHVAINKIHPKTFNMVEPYKAYKKLAQVAIELEKEFSLQETNHVPRYTQSENLAHDFEYHTGIESLINWVKTNCLNKLNEAKNWTEFNQTLAENGLNIKVRANGFVITSKNGVMAKASSVSRNFSKSKLEDKFGQFQSASSMIKNNIREYQRYPINKTTSSSKLYALYQEESMAHKIAFSEQLMALRTKKSRLIEKAKSRGKLKRGVIKLTRASRLEKKVLYKFVSKKLQDEINKANRLYKQDYNKLSEQYKYLSWSDWLQKKVLAGSCEALEAMRFKKKKSTGNPALSGRNLREQYIDREKLDILTKEGTAIYKLGESLVKDNGNEITISKGISIKGLKNSIEMAKKQYGSCIAVNGSQQFKRVIARIAVYHDMQVTFDDSLTESFRKNFTKELEKTSEQQKTRRDDRRGANIRGDESTRASNRGDRHRGSNRDSTPRTKSHANGARREPPTESQNSLRTMSQLNVVQLTGRSKVLLPSNAHDLLECQRTKPDNKVRRSIFGRLLDNKKKKRNID